jgi:hypothetical protein
MATSEICNLYVTSHARTQELHKKYYLDNRHERAETIIEQTLSVDPHQVLATTLACRLSPHTASESQPDTRRTIQSVDCYSERSHAHAPRLS